MPIFTNQASLTYNNVVTNSNVVTGNLVESLTATKTALADTYNRGDSITYVVTVANTGTAPYTALTITDDLGAYTFGAGTVRPLTYIDGTLRYYLDGTLQPTPAVTTDNGLTVTNITIPAGETALFVYQARTNGFAPLGTADNIVNTVNVTGGGLTEAVTATNTVTPVAGANLAITKSISPATVTENGQLTYTFVIENYGNTATTVADDLTVTDTFNPVLENITVTYNDTVLTPNTDYTYTGGTFTTTNGVITVPAATYTQGADGTYTVTPGVSVITVTGTV